MKPRILILARYYLPAYLAGGPVRSIANIVERLEGFDWKIITGDRDLGSPLPYDAPLNQWVSTGKVTVKYVPADTSKWRFLKILREPQHDLFYLNSFFDIKFSIFPVFIRRLGILPRKPLLIAPRGEFSPGALGLKALKKKFFITIGRVTGTYRDAHWQASSEQESRYIQHVMKVKPERIWIARNLTPPLGDSNPPPHPREGRLRVCFFSRIARMKNLDYALRVLAETRVPINFEIYGPKEDESYWNECETLIRKLPENIKVAYMGSLPSSKIRETLSKQDVLFLPTRGENFGHVLMEAWSSGIQVLTSDQTPWRNLESRGVGWDLPLGDTSRFAHVLEEISGIDPEQRLASRQKCLDFARLQSEDREAMADNIEMFHKALLGGTT